MLEKNLQSEGFVEVKVIPVDANFEVLAEEPETLVFTPNQELLTVYEITFYIKVLSAISVIVGLLAGISATLAYQHWWLRLF